MNSKTFSIGSTTEDWRHATLHCLSKVTDSLEQKTILKQEDKEMIQECLQAGLKEAAESEFRKEDAEYRLRRMIERG